MHKKTNVLITGAAGFIGSHIIETLATDPSYAIIGVDNLDEYYINQKRSNLLELQSLENFHFIEADILDEAAMSEIFEKYRPATVIHLAARPGVRSSFETKELHERINIDGTKVIVRLVQQFGVKKFIFASSSSVYGNRESGEERPFKESDPLNPMSPYASSKLKAEQLITDALANSPVSVTILRLFSVYGERMRPDLGPSIFTDAIIHHRPFVKFGNGDTKRDYTYVKDIVAGFVIAMQDGTLGVQTFNVGSSNPVSLNAIIELLEEILQQKAVTNTKPSQQGEANYTYADITKLKEKGYAPSISIEDGLRRFTDWYQQHSQ